jgi:uncharacterized protein DUF4232
MRGRLLLLVPAVLAVVGCGGTKTVTQTTTVVHTTTVQVTTTTSAATGATACTGDAMTGLFTAIPGSAGAGNIGYRLHVTNASPVACFVSGLPNAQLISTTGHDLPTNVVPAQPGQATAARIVLQPGAAATADARFSPDVPGGSEPTDAPCEPKAGTLRVAFAGAPLDATVTPPTPVCERGTLQFSLFTAAG